MRGEQALKCIKASEQTRLSTCKQKKRSGSPPDPPLACSLRWGSLAAICAAAGAALLAELLTRLSALGDGHAAVAVGVEPGETLQRAGAELLDGDGAAGGEEAAALTAPCPRLRLPLGLALRPVLGALLRGHRLDPRTTLGAALGTLLHTLRALLHALSDTGASLLGHAGQTLLAALHPLGAMLLAAGPHLLARDAAVAVRVETGEARFGAGDGLLAGDFSAAAAALGRLGARGAGSGQQCAGDDAELDGFHG